MKKTNTKSHVLLIGGLAMKGDELNDLANRLNQIGSFTFLSFDNINVGSGPRVDLKIQDLTIFDQAAHQWQKVNEVLNTSEGKISIFGISMGGMIAATMVYLFPDRVDKLILSATSANLSTAPAVPDSLYNKWTQAKTAEEIWDAVTIAFGRSTFEKNPTIPKEYFNYRASGANGQKAKEFVSQVNSIRTFEGEKVYSKIGQNRLAVSVLSGDEDILFDRRHVEDIKSKIPTANHFEFPNTGHMLHLENPSGLASKVFEILEG